MSCLMQVVSHRDVFSYIEPYLTDRDIANCLQVSQEIKEEISYFFFASVELDLENYLSTLETLNKESIPKGACQHTRAIEIQDSDRERYISDCKTRLGAIKNNSSRGWVELFSRLHTTPLPSRQIQPIVFKALRLLTDEEGVDQWEESLEVTQAVTDLTADYLQAHHFLGALKVAKIFRHHCSLYKLQFDEGSDSPLFRSLLYRNLKTIEKAIIDTFIKDKNDRPDDQRAKVAFIYYIDQVAHEWLALREPHCAESALRQVYGLTLSGLQRRRSTQHTDLAEAYLATCHTYIQMDRLDMAREMMEVICVEAIYKQAMEAIDKKE